MDEVGGDARRRSRVCLQDRPRLPGHRYHRQLRPDLDTEAELKVIEDMEIEDNEGLSVLPACWNCSRRCRRERWTVVTSATERLARARMASGGIPVPERLVTAEYVTPASPT